MLGKKLNKVIIIDDIYHASEAMLDYITAFKEMDILIIKPEELKDFDKIITDVKNKLIICEDINEYIKKIPVPKNKDKPLIKKANPIDAIAKKRKW